MYFDVHFFITISILSPWSFIIRLDIFILLKINVGMQPQSFGPFRLILQNLPSGFFSNKQLIAPVSLWNTVSNSMVVVTICKPAATFLRCIYFRKYFSQNDDKTCPSGVNLSLFVINQSFQYTVNFEDCDI